MVESRSDANLITQSIIDLKILIELIFSLTIISALLINPGQMKVSCGDINLVILLFKNFKTLSEQGLRSLIVTSPCCYAEILKDIDSETNEVLWP